MTLLSSTGISDLFATSLSQAIRPPRAMVVMPKMMARMVGRGLDLAAETGGVG